MNLSKFRNEKGFTLIETIASLFLIGLIAVAVSTFTLNAHSDRESVANRIELQEDTNRLLSGINKSFTAGIAGGTLTHSFQSDHVRVTEVLDKGTPRETGQTLTGLRSNEALSLDITTVHESGDEIKIKTSVRKPQNETLRITLKPRTP